MARQDIEIKGDVMGEAKRKPQKEVKIEQWTDKQICEALEAGTIAPLADNPFKSERMIEGDLFQDTINALMALRDDVDNINKSFKNKLFKERILAGNQICTVDVNGIRYGYKLIDLGVTMKRVILMKPINAKFSEFSDEDRRKAIIPVFEVFLREGMNDIEIEAKGGCIEITQEFAPMYLYERTQGPYSILKGKN
jgi:hypothetical protein